MKKDTLVFCSIILFLCVHNASLAQFTTKQEKGYFNITNIFEGQILKSIDSTILNKGSAKLRGGVEFNTINGYFLHPNFSIGLGVGVQLTNYKYYPSPGTKTLKTNGTEIVSLPVFADFRYYPAESINTAMFIIKAGYAPVIKMKYEEHKPFLNGGAFIKIGAGYKFYVNEIMAFLPTLNFRAQRFGDNTVLGGSVGVGFLF